MPTDLVLGASIAAGTLLGVSGLTIAGIQATRHGSFRTSPLIAKWATWTVLAAMWLLTMTSEWILLAVLLAIAAIGGWEYARLAALRRSDAVLTIAVSLIGIGLVALGVDAAAVLGFMLVSVTLPAVVRQDLEGGAQRTGRLLLGIVVSGLAPVGLLHLGRTDSVVFAVVLFGVALSDVLAFTLGSLIRGPRLAVRLSPAKTWTGAVGNLLGALGGVGVASTFATVGMRDGLVLAVVIAIGSVWGDLLESLLKRVAGVKDTGRLLPGFGGILDRVDSLIVSVPLVVFVTALMRST